MTTERAYPIGTPGQPWGAEERALWRAGRLRRRSYEADVLSVLKRLEDRFLLRTYGRVDCGPDGVFPLMALFSQPVNPHLPTMLITGGVHGYETSGVHGALAFADQHADDGRANLVIAPCVSPWAYERIERWNAQAVDPNRSFREGASSAPESAALMEFLRSVGPIAMHIDLHETTDTDESEFRPALAARDGKPFEPDTVPDGFYLVDDTVNPQPAFSAAILEAVAKVTPDASPQIFPSISANS